MKILYHHRTLGDGAEGIHIAEMVKAFRQLGHEVNVIGPGVKESKGFEEKSDKFFWIKKYLNGPLYELAELSYNFFGYRNICRAIRDYQPDLIYDRYITFNYSAIAAGKKHNLPVFLEINSPLAYEREFSPDENLYLKKMAYYIEKKTYSDADLSIVVSTPLKSYLMSIGIPERKILLLPNGVNNTNFYPRAKSKSLMNKLKFGEDNIIVGFTGIIRPWHGIDLLLNAFKNAVEKQPSLKLLLVGDGPIRGEIESKIDHLNIRKQVIITGRVPHAQVGEYISLFDIAVSPKATFYASPMKIIEYMAQKKAVIAPDMPNIRDLLENNENGLLFDVGDANSLGNKILTCAINKEGRDRLGEKALATVKQKLNWQANATRIVSEYNRINQKIQTFDLQYLKK